MESYEFELSQAVKNRSYNFVQKVWLIWDLIKWKLSNKHRSIPHPFFIVSTALISHLFYLLCNILIPAGGSGYVADLKNTVKYARGVLTERHCIHPTLIAVWEHQHVETLMYIASSPSWSNLQYIQLSRSEDSCLFFSRSLLCQNQICYTVHQTILHSFHFF